MSKKIRIANRDQIPFLIFRCPGCGENHGFPVNVDGLPPKSSRGWRWNGSESSPTITPSIKVSFTKTDPDGKFIADVICHSFVTDGKIMFCGDSTHEFAGKTLDLEDIEDG